VGWTVKTYWVNVLDPVHYGDVPQPWVGRAVGGLYGFTAYTPFMTRMDLNPGQDKNWGTFMVLGLNPMHDEAGPKPRAGRGLGSRRRTGGQRLKAPAGTQRHRTSGL
jgi:hypothetical protein